MILDNTKMGFAFLEVFLPVGGEGTSSSVVIPFPLSGAGNSV